MRTFAAGHCSQIIPLSVLITDHLLAISIGMQRSLNILSVCLSVSCARAKFCDMIAVVAACSLLCSIAAITSYCFEAFVGSNSVLAFELGQEHFCIVSGHLTNTVLTTSSSSTIVLLGPSQIVDTALIAFTIQRQSPVGAAVIFSQCYFVGKISAPARMCRKHT